MYVEYRGGAHVHERCIVSIPGCKHVVVVTPHFDMYVELIAGYEVVYPSGPRQGVPGTWRRPGRNGLWVRFDLDILQRGLPDLFRAAEIEAVSTRKVIRIDGSSRPGDELGEEPEKMAIVAVDALPADQPVASGIWMAMEDRYGFSVGQPVDLTTGTVRISGDRGCVETTVGSIAISAVGSWNGAFSYRRSAYSAVGGGQVGSS